MIDSQRAILKATLLLFLALSLSSPFVLVRSANGPSQSAEYAEYIAKDFNPENVKKHIEYLSSLSSRVSGYPGFFKAADYVVSNLEDFGVKPFGDEDSFFEDFSVTVPIDHGSYVQIVGGQKFKAYALWPNYVNPSPYVSPEEGDEIVDVGKGLPEDFNFKDLAGKFVLMDFDSRWFFRYAAMYGAKGIIYVGDEITRSSAFQMTYNIPLSFPRLYLDRNDGLKLREELRKSSTLRIKVVSNMSWESVQVPNIVGIIPGQGELSNEYIVLCAFLDSWSIVPALSPGATDAINVAALLEASRILSKSDLQRSVILLVAADHWQGLWGTREWIERHWDMVGTSIKAFISLDLSYDNKKLSLTNIGTTYSYVNVNALNVRYSWIVNRFFNSYLQDLKSIYGSSFGADFVDKILLTYPPAVSGMPLFEGVGTTSYDSEPYALAAFGGGFAFHTTDSMRIWSKTPNDVAEKVNYENLNEQIIAIIYTLGSLANEPTIDLTQTPTRVSPTGEWGYCTLKIKVAEYNVSSAFWDAFTKERRPEEWENLIVHFTSYTAAMAAAGQMLGTSALGGVIDVMAKPDENGIVTIYGLKPYTSGSIEAYVVNKTNGQIEWATDLGVYRAPLSRPGELRITTPVYEQIISLFPSGSIALFSLFNPSDLSPIQNIAVYNFLSHGPMIRYGILSNFYGDIMVFVRPDVPTEILLYTGARFPAGVLMNASEEYPEGYGYTVKQGETIRILNTPYEISSNLRSIVKARSSVAKNYDAYNPSIVIYEDLGEEYFSNATQSYRDRIYAKSYGFAYSAWAFIQQAYLALMDLIWQIVYSIVFITMMLVAFSVLFERLVFAKHGPKRIGFLIVSLVSMLVFISFFHPGFYIATNAGMSIIAFGIFTITIPLLGFIIADVYSSAKILKESLLGYHSIEVSRLGIATAALNLGIENMKKRKLRSLLTLISLILVIFALIAFTSIAATPIPRTEQTERETLYPGILVRRLPRIPIPEELYFQLKYQYDDVAYVVPRIWIFPPPPIAGGGGVTLITFTNKTQTTIGALWGLTPEEDNVSKISRSIIRGRWLIPTDKFVCLISERTAQNLTRELGRPINLGSTINIWGVDLVVVGIFDGDILWSGSAGMVDLDEEPITPYIPFVAYGELENVAPPHYAGSQVIIIPYRLAARIMETTYDPTWRFFLSCIAISPKKIEYVPVIEKLSMNIALRTAIDVYYTTSTKATGEVSILKARQWYTATGFEMLMAPIIIGGFVILNMMLTAVYERVREIKIFAAVGLSPFHTSLMFLAESVTYGVLACVLGYLMGIVGTRILSRLNMYPPGFYPNYASFIVLITLLLGMGMVLLSTIYPASKSSTAALPSLQRKWRIPSPGAKTWSIPLPFVVSTEDEASGIIAFLKEFLGIHSSESAGSFTAQDIKYSAFRKGDTIEKTLEAYVRLAPYDAGVSQNLTFKVYSRKSGRFNMIIQLERELGLRTTWISSNRPFIDGLRKQLLLWRALPPEQKRKYIEEGKKLDDKINAP